MVSVSSYSDGLLKRRFKHMFIVIFFIHDLLYSRAKHSMLILGSATKQIYKSPFKCIENAARKREVYILKMNEKRFGFF